ncbi:37722_t:CDS:2, partial [Gigaspora margarita]
NNSMITQPLEVTKTTQELPKSTSNSELMLNMALQLDQIEEQDTTLGSLEINTQEALEETPIPVYMRGNKNKRDEIDTLGSTSNAVTQHQESYPPEMTTKDTLPEDAK